MNTTKRLVKKLEISFIVLDRFILQVYLLAFFLSLFRFENNISIRSYGDRKWMSKN
jgi:hypothetical protein